MSPDNCHCFLIREFWKRHLSFLLIIASIISLSSPVYPAAASPRKKFRREAAPFPVPPFFSNKTSQVFLSTATENIFPPRRPERKQRFCLNRLRDALEIVCSSGSIDRIPTYFNPTEYTASAPATGPILNGSVSNARASRKLRNEISTMAQPQPKRHVLRRRSRRNIVRECCERPCTYSYLSKYCSPSVRESAMFSDPDIQPENSLSPPPPPSTSSSSHQQCVTVSDLQNYYLKFFHKQWKKNGYSNQKGQLFQEPDSQEEKSSHLNNHNNLNDDEEEVTFPDAFFKNLRKQSKQATDTSPSTATEEESRTVNEIDENAVSQRKRIDQSGNIMTAPPINFVINLPRGTNDYIY